MAMRAIPPAMAAMVGKSTPEGGIGCGLAAGAQETSEVQVSAPAPWTVTQALLRQALWVWATTAGGVEGVTVVTVGGGSGQTQLGSVIQLTLRQLPPAQVSPEPHSSLTVQLSLQTFNGGGHWQSVSEEQAALRHRPLIQASSFGQSAELVQVELHAEDGGGQEQLVSLTHDGLRHFPLEQTVPLGQSLLAAQSELQTGVGGAATTKLRVQE